MPRTVHCATSRVRLVAAAVLLLALPMCSSDDDDGAASTATTAATETTAVITVATTVETTVETSSGAVTSTTVAASPTSSLATVAEDAPAACAGLSEGTVDPTRLPVGDMAIAATPTCGLVVACQTAFNGGGANAQGPWFNRDGTWDLTKKLTVGGSVVWEPEFDIVVDGDQRVISSNDLPDHATGEFPIGDDEEVHQYDRNPNSISEQQIEYSLPANPTVQGEPSCVGGQLGILLTGAVLFNAFDAAGRDAVAWEAQDECEGHPQAQGVYHYHSLTTCVDDPGTGHSALLGYAYDGFGIYGNRGVDGMAVTNADLDECHGHTHTITWDGAEVEMYHYHATVEFPYVIGCFRGAAIEVSSGEGGAPPRTP